MRDWEMLTSFEIKIDGNYGHAVCSKSCSIVSSVEMGCFQKHEHVVQSPRIVRKSLIRDYSGVEQERDLRWLWFKVWCLVCGPWNENNRPKILFKVSTRHLAPALPNSGLPSQD